VSFSHFRRLLKRIQISNFFSTRSNFNASFLKLLIFLIESMLTLPFFSKKSKYKKIRKIKKYLNKETKIQRKKMKDQSVFETKQWGRKKTNYFAYKYMIISHKEKGRQKNLKKIQKKKNQILSLTHKKILNLFCYFLATSHQPPYKKKHTHNLHLHG